MKEKEEECLRFVLENYRHGVFDTCRAIRKLKARIEVPKQRRNFRYYWTSAAACLLLCLGTFLYTYVSSEENEWTRLTSGKNTVRYLLPDSTSVTLSPRSTLCYQPARFGNRQREVRMSGKVYFDVRRNPSSPFRVMGRYAEVEVLGTRFQIDEQQPDSITEVYVSSGKILFASNGNNTGVILTKGMQAQLPFGKKIPQVMTPETPNPSAWAIGTFVYDNTPLSKVLKELSSYYGVPLSTSSDKMLTAEFGTDNLNEIIILIEQSLDVKIERK